VEASFQSFFQLQPGFLQALRGPQQSQRTIRKLPPKRFGFTWLVADPEPVQQLEILKIVCVWCINRQKKMNSYLKSMITQTAFSDIITIIHK
jgi:hypothetical protein